MMTNALRLLLVLGLPTALAFYLFSSPVEALAQDPSTEATADAYFRPQENMFATTTPPKPAGDVESKVSTMTETRSALGEKFAPTQVIAIVGGEPIFLGDMMLEINQWFEQVMEGAPPEIKAREKEAALPMIIPRFIPKYIDSKLLYLDSVSSLPDGVTVDSILDQAGKDFDEKALDKILEKSGLHSPIEYDAQLRTMGSSLRKMRTSWSIEQFIGYFVNQKLKYDKDVTHDELLTYYNAHLAEYELEEKVRWEELMISFSSHSTKEEAYQELVEIGNEVVYGARLDAVAKRASDGLTAMSGGQYEWTTRGSLVAKNLEDLLFELPLNELSDIIETQQGVHIVRVIERQNAGRVSFRDAQSKIKEKLVEENRAKAFEAHLAKLRDEIPFEIVWK
ncbi:MAG: peptidylprolyl isomerase [Pirellulaceae bacterium]